MSVLLAILLLWQASGQQPASAAVTDLPSLQAAVDAACAAGGSHTVQLPAGVIELRAANGKPTLRVTDRRLRLVGAGEEATVLSWPETPQAAYPGIEYTSPAGLQVELSDVTVRGPPVAGPWPDVWDGRHSGLDNPRTVGISLPAQSAGGAYVRLRRVRLEGKWLNGIALSSGTATHGLTLSLDECDLSAYVSVVGLFGTEGMTDLWLEATGTYFRNGGLHIGNDPRHQPQYGECLYIHPHCGVRLTRCLFGPMVSFSVQHYSGDAINVTPPPAASYTDCLWLPGSGAVLTSDTGESVFNNCTFRGGGVQARGEVVINGGLFTQEFVNIAGSGTFRRCEIAGARFRHTRPGGPIACTAAGDWIVRDCSFIASGPTPPGSFIATSDIAARLRVEGCTFDSSGTTDPNWPMLYHILLKGGSTLALWRCSSVGSTWFSALGHDGTWHGSQKVMDCTGF